MAGSPQVQLPDPFAGTRAVRPEKSNLAHMHSQVSDFPPCTGFGPCSLFLSQLQVFVLIGDGRRLQVAATPPPRREDPRSTQHQLAATSLAGV